MVTTHVSTSGFLHKGNQGLLAYKAGSLLCCGVFARAAALGPHGVRGNHGIVLNNNGIVRGFVDARSRQVYFASAEGFAGVRSCETAFCGAWPFGGRLVALGFSLGFSAALPFPHVCNSIFVCIELIEEKESHVATSVYPSHYVCVPWQHLTVRTNRLINEWFVLFV